MRTNLWQRVLSFTLALVMVLGMVPSGVIRFPEASAEDVGGVTVPDVNPGSGSTTTDPYIILMKDGQSPTIANVASMLKSAFGFWYDAGGWTSDKDFARILRNNSQVLEITNTNQSSTSTANFSDGAYTAEHRKTYITTWTEATKYLYAKTYHEFTVSMSDEDGIASADGIDTSMFQFSAVDQLDENGAVLDFTKDSFPLTLEVPMPTLEAGQGVSISVEVCGKTYTFDVETAIANNASTVSVQIPYVEGEGGTTSGNIAVTYQEIKYHAVKLQSNLSEGVTYTVTDLDTNTPIDPVDGVYYVQTNSNISISATGPDGATVMRWWKVNQDGKTVADPSSLTIAADATYEVVYQCAANPVAIKNITKDLSYTEYEKYLAFTRAASGDTLRVERNVTLEQNVTIPVGVTLLVPCMDGDTGLTGSASGDDPPDGNLSVAYGTETLYRTLTVSSGVTLTVNGTLLVNAQVGYSPSSPSEQKIQGNYGKIALNGSIHISSTGTMKNFGRTQGGKITVDSGGTIGDLFVLENWRGGSYASIAAFGNLISGAVGLLHSNPVLPLSSYHMNNITSDIEIEAGASFFGLIKMVANDGYFYANLQLVGDKDNGILRLLNGSMTKTHKDGVDTYTFDGDLDVKNTTLSIGVNLDTGDFFFPIVHDMKIVVTGEHTATMYSDMKVSYGASIHLKNGAKLVVAEGVRIALYARNTPVYNGSYTNKFRTDGETRGTGVYDEQVNFYPYDPDKQYADAYLEMEDTCSIDIKSGAYVGGMIKSLDRSKVTFEGGSNQYVRALEASAYQDKSSVTRTFYEYVWTWYYADYAGLKAALAQYNGLKNTLSGNFTEASITALTNAVNAANAHLTGAAYPLTNTTENQATVDALATAITDAIAGLTYTVTLDAQGGTGAPNTLTLTYGAETYGELPTPSMTGYTFDGWKNESGATVTGTSVPTKGHHTLTAQWTAKQYDVSFDLNYEGAAAISSQKVTFDSTYGELPKPTREGYTFDGWYLNGTKVESTTTVSTADKHTLTAQWTINQYTALFKYEKDGDTYKSFTQNYGTTVTLPEISKTGYRFLGWFYLDESNTETKQGESFEMPVNGKTLFAKWEANQYTVNFDANGGDVTQTSKEVTFDSKYSTLPVPTRKGYTFAGWYTDTTYTIEVTQDTIVKDATEEGHTLYAKWNVNSYELVWDFGGGSTDESYTAAGQVNYGTQIVLPALSKTGYTFNGWKDQTNNTYQAGNTVAMGVDGLTLTAQWTANTYTVEFDAKGGSACNEITVTFDSAYGTLPVPTREGYTFAGWFADENCTEGNQVTAETEYTTDGNTTLYANWSAKSYTVNFDANQGECATTEKTVTYAGFYGELPTPTRTGYTFQGWYLDDTKVESNTTVTTAENHKLIAEWKENTYTVVYKPNGGSGDTVLQSFVHTDESALIQGNPFTREGYTFAGWKDENGNSYDIDTQLKNYIGAWEDGHTLTLTAQWTAKQYDVSFDLNYEGAAAISSQKVTFDSTYGELPKPTREGYIFDGWYTDADCTQGNQVNGETKYTTVGGTFLYAKWSANTYKVSFDLNYEGVENPAFKNVAFNGAYGDLPAPERTGYTFGGWFTDDQDFANQVTAETVYTTAGNTTLYAKWTINSYTVTWVVDGTEYEKETYEYGTDIILPEAPTKTGHGFAGWEGYTSGMVMPDCDKTFTANWTVNSYNLSWELNGGTASNEYTDGSVPYGATITAPIVTRTGYTFTGWSPAVPATMGAADAEYTATWTANTDTAYTVKHYWMDVDGNYPETTTEINTSYGTTDTDTDWQDDAKSAEGFAVDTSRTGNVQIKADGTAVLKIYYARNQYQAVWNVDGTETGETYYYGQTIPMREAPSKDGYTFKEWSGYTAGMPMPVGGVTLTAVWTPITYNISYELNGGVVAGENPGTYTIESESFTLVNPTKTGYTFWGWTWEGRTEPVETVTIEKGSLENRSYTAKWKINQYTITFVLGNGEANIVKTQDYGTDVTAPADPTRVGYTFKEWDAEIPENMPAGDMIIHATWTPIVYYVVFDANGGTNAMSNQPFTYDVVQQLIKNQFHREGYAFAGWNTARDGSGTTYADMQQVFNLADTQNAEVTLYAQWNAGEVNYKVEHYWMELDGTYCETTEDQETKSGTTDTEVTAQVHQKIQEGFTMDAEKSVTVTISGDGTTILKIYYTRNQYTVTWNLDGTETEKTYYYGETISKKETPFKEGHTFAGWQDYADNMTMPANNVTFTATWTVNSYDLSWELNGGTASNEYTSGKVPYGTGITAPIVTREGYSFAGWDESVPNTMPAEVMAFTAQWTANQYNVTFDANGGSACVEIEVSFNSAYGELPTPTKTGYDFGGWYSDEALTNSVTAETVYTTAGDTILYAEWTPVNYTITYDLAGGAVNGTNPGTYTIETPDFTLINPTKTGYTFAGWSVNDGTERTDTVTVEQGSYGNRTYTAKWTANQYSITFVLDNGENDIVLTQDYGTAVAAPANMTKVGYTFAKWDKTVPATMGAENIIITAAWTPNADTAYKVEHYLMNVDGQGYTLIETENLNGTTGAEITPAVKTYEGFTAPDVQTVTIAPDGSLVVVYQYARKQYKVTWDVDGTETEETYAYGATINMPVDPAKTGYEFDGWDPVVPDTMGAADAIYTATWTAKTYHVALNANGGTVNPISKPVTFDRTYGALPTPERKGYVFAGWYTAAEGGSQVTEATVFDKDAAHTLYAHWTPGTTTYTVIHWKQNLADDGYTEENRQTIPNAVTEGTTSATPWTFTGFTAKEIEQQVIIGNGSTVVNIYYDRNIHTLTWDANGGELSGEYTSGPVRYGTPIIAPAVSRNGYTSDGWGVTVAATVPDHDLTYTAKWNVIPYTITYVGLDGAQNGNPAGYHVESETFTLADPVKTGYTFLGWTWDGQTTSVKDVTIVKGTTGDRIYTANWEKNTYTVIFDANGGSGDQMTQTLTWDGGAEELTSNTYTRKGYTFQGWARTENAAVAAYADGAEVSNLVSEGTITLYAVWKLDPYTIRYVLDGGMVATQNPTSYTVESDSFTLTNPTKTGYTFLGWTVNGGSEKQMEVTISKGSIGDLEFTANWEKNTYTITFHSNGGDPVDDISREYQGTVLAGDVVKPGREGHRFAGWFLDEALTKSVTYPVTMTGNLEFYAKWTINQYTITFANTGDTVIDPITQDYGTDVTAPGNPTKIGYTFAGWDVEIPDTMPGANITVTAKWTVNRYTITFANTGDTVIDPITQDYGTNVTAPGNPTKKGYTFAGWDLTVPGTMPAGNMTITAKWTINQYSVRFDTAGGEAVDPITQDYLTQVDALPDAVRAGYRFDGWFYADGTSVAFPITLEDDVDVVAHWTSYLDLLMAIAPADFANAETGGEDREVLEQARVYFNLMKLDSTLLTKYQGAEEPYASHWDALEAEIREVTLLELEVSIEGEETLDKVNDLLTDNGKASATLVADPVTNYVEIWIEEPNRKAGDFLVIKFLTTLLNHQDIWSIHFPAMEGETENGVPLTPYGNGMGTFDQLNLMIRVAYVTINTPEFTKTESKLTYGEFVTWLQQNREITVGVMDGKSVEIVVNAKTPEGVEFSTNYVLSFCNRAHDVTWDVDGVVSSKSYNYNDLIIKPVDPVKEGYTFAGWEGYTDGMTMGKKNVTFKATWTINSYDVTWNVDGDTTVVLYEYGAVIRLPEAPSKVGHSFTGWEGYTDGMTMPAENLTFHAVWDALEFTVTFNSDGGTAVGSVTQDYGTQVSAPAVPEKTGYTFGGWYNGDTKVEFPLTMPAGGLNLKAKWIANQYTVTLDASGGSVGQETVTVTYGQPYGLPTPSRDGYTFDGWFHNGILVSANVDITADATFVARWTLGNPYNISYDLDDGQWAEGTSPRVQYTVETDSFTLPTPTREGYTFAGWTGTDLTQPTREVTVPKGSVGDRSYTANWTVNQYTITFVQGNEEADIVLNQNYGTGVTAPADPVREGYTFGGWDLTVPGTMPAENLVITAKWTINRYTVTFVPGNGDENIVLKQDYGTGITAPADPVREGYTFRGWDKTVPDTMPAGDMTIHALWEINVYTITFDPAGGTAVNPIQDVYGAPINAPADPTREGYTFDGWNVEIPGAMPAGNMTITAKWKVNTYTLTYLVDGVVYKTLRMNFGAEVMPEAAPTRTGHTFSGWDKTVVQMPAGDVQISGTFSANSYTVHFNANYPTAPAVADMTVTFDGVYGTLPVVSRTGYTFSGWTLDGVAVTEDTLVRTAGEHTLVALWTPNTYKVTLILAGGESNVTEITVAYDGTYTELPVPTREGYDFLGWFDGETQVLSSNQVTVTADQTLTARWKASGNTPYIVEHYQQALDGSYVLVLTENLTGAADTQTQAQQQSYEGFHVNASLGTASGMILPDGSLVLKLYYDRNSYDVVWNVAETQIRETYLYGQALNVPDTARMADVHARYDFVKWDQDLPETVTASANYTAEYSLYYEATIGSVTYRTLALALEHAKAGETVRLARDVTVSENLTVPKNVLLLIPCKDDDNGYDLKYSGKLKFNYDAPDSNGTASLYRTLTIGDGATLTIQGTVLLNSVSGRTGSGEQDITGGYGRMVLNGEVVVADGGLLDCFGFITGSGKVIIQDGGTASDMYIVRHWRGGTQAYNMYVEEIYPMNEYDCRNIEVDVVVHYGGSYEGLVKMYAGNEYNYTRYPQVHVTNGLIRLTSQDGYVVRSYADGVETYKIYGGAEFANSALTILGVDLTTADFVYPIDGDIRFELYDGRYDIVNDYKFLPGSSVLVGADASLKIAAGTTVVFYQEFNDVDNTGNTEYPAGRAPAVLTIQAGASFTNAGTFAGHIYTESPDIWIGVDPLWDTVTKEANGLAASLPDGVESYVELAHTLSMERPGHTWHYGADKSIVWDGYADYSAVQQAIASIPKDLKYYTDASVTAIQPAVDAVVYNLPYERQAEVDAMAIPIQEAVAGLVPRTVTVTLDPNGGTVAYTSFEATCTMAIGTLPTPTRQYYTFQGWYDAEGNRVTAKTVVWFLDDIQLTAKWKLKDADNTVLILARRKVPADMSMYSAESVAAVNAALEAADYNLTADRQDEVNAMAQAILDAIDNLAYTVTLDPNGGTVEPQTLEKVRKETNYAGLPTPTRPGYRFDGWFNSEGTQITAESTPTQGQHTLTALWTILPADYTAVDAALEQIPADMTIYTEDTAAAVQTAVNGVVRGLMSDRQAEVDAMAQTIRNALAALELRRITVTLAADGGTVTPNTVTVTCTKIYGNLPVPVKPGFLFTGWYTADGKCVEADTVVESRDDLILTARWVEDKADYTVVENAKAQIPADLHIYSDATVAVLNAAVNAVDYNLTADRQAEVNAMAQAILDAIAGLVKQTVTVTTDDGSIEKEVVYGEPIGTLPEPEDDCKIFLGWYNEAGERVTEDTVISSLDDLMLTAKWQDVCLETDGNHYSMIIHYHGTAGEITSVDVTVEDTVGVDSMTLRLPAALPTTKDATQAPLIHVQVPEGFKLRLEIPMDTQHYGNVAMIDTGTAAQSGTAEMTIINETVVTDTGVALAVTGSMDIRVVENSHSFPDVPDGFWSKNEVDYLTARKFILGKYDGTYAPTETIMRKTVVMLLWRFAGSPDPSSMVSPFPDVQDPNDIYYKAILWAYENGITRGYTDGTFGGDNVILRQHFAAMVHRYASIFDYELPAHDNGDLENFVDYALIGESFHEDVQWALDCGLMLGHRDGRYNPRGETPRDQMSVVFFRFLQSYHKAMYEADPE